MLNVSSWSSFFFHFVPLFSLQERESRVVHWRREQKVVVVVVGEGGQEREGT